MNNKLKPAIIGGVVIGLLSVIPFVNWVNFCCCLWAILGGVLASYLYIKNSPTPASPGDGAILGVLAGVVAAVIAIVVGIPLSILTSGLVTGLLVSLIENVDPSQAEMMRRQMIAGQTVAGAIVNGIILAILLVIFSTLGGLLGIPLFEKRKRDTLTPPPAQNFGGGAGPGNFGSGV
jgi:CDP-diglyceride synthetase